MITDISSHPSTPRGLETLTNELLPTVVKLWKRDRDHIGDDLVAIVNTHTNQVQVEPRKEVYDQLKTYQPHLDFLPRLMSPAPGPGAPLALGSIRIWVIIGFTDGHVGLRSVTLARS